MGVCNFLLIDLQIANFVSEPVRKLQICKVFLKKFPPFIAKLSKSCLEVCLAEFFIWYKFELEHFRYVFVKQKNKEFADLQKF